MLDRLRGDANLLSDRTIARSTNEEHQYANVLGRDQRCERRRGTNFGDNRWINHRLSGDGDFERMDQLGDVIRAALEEVGPAAAVALWQAGKDARTSVVGEQDNAASGKVSSDIEPGSQSAARAIEVLPGLEDEVQHGSIGPCCR